MQIGFAVWMTYNKDYSHFKARAKEALIFNPLPDCFQHLQGRQIAPRGTRKRFQAERVGKIIVVQVRGRRLPANPAAQSCMAARNSQRHIVFLRQAHNGGVIEPSPSGYRLGRQNRYHTCSMQVSITLRKFSSKRGGLLASLVPRATMANAGRWMRSSQARGDSSLLH